MKAATLNGKQAVVSSRKLDGRVGRALIIKRLMRSFDYGSEFDGEKKTGLSLKVSFSA